MIFCSRNVLPDLRSSMQTGRLLPVRSDLSQVTQGGSSLGPSTVQLLLSGATGLRQVTIDSKGIMFEVYDQGFMFSKICMASFISFAVCICLLFVVIFWGLNLELDLFFAGGYLFLLTDILLGPCCSPNLLSQSLARDSN